MSMNRLFELIRKEDLVIFCGAGMSMYAGYPSGGQVADQVYDQLTEHERAEVGLHLALPELTEEVVNLRMGRQWLIALLKENFLKPPKDYSLHSKLADIPHIKTIITTNYDRLFETAYGSECSVVSTSSDLPYLKKGIPEIFKIHGDIGSPDTILITKSDYTRFFDSQKQEVMWNVVKERIATHHLLFIGYNLDDINMESIFHKLREHLGDNHKEVFLLSPGLKAPKKQKLIRDSVHYIDDVAQNFIELLLRDIKNNIYEDFKKGWCSAETFRKFLNKNNLAPTLKAVDDRFEVTKMDSIGKPLEGKFNFAVSADNADFIEKLNRFFNNQDLDEITLDNTNVQDLHLYFNDIKIPAKEGGAFTFSSMPIVSGHIDITFDNGNEYEQIKTDVYRTQTDLIFQLHFPNIELKFITNSTDLRNLPYEVKINRPREFGKVTDEVRTSKFLHDLGSSVRFTIHIKNVTPTSLRLQNAPQLIALAEKYLYYFERIKRIERHYNIKFGDLGELTTDSYNMLNMIIDHIDGVPYVGVFESTWDFQAPDSEKSREFLKHITPDAEFFRKNDIAETWTFHGKEIYMGFRKTRLLEPYVENLEEIEKSNSLNSVRMASKSQSIAITFANEL